MTAMLGGVDVSGDPDGGHDKFMSIIIGTEEKISSMIQILGRETIHMHEIRGNMQNEIISKLNFKDNDCMAMCLRIEKQRITNKIKNLRKVRTRNTRKRKIYTTYDYTLWNLMQDRIKEFLQGHGCDLHDVVFQCDHDSDAFLKTAGLGRSYKGHAYVLSDIVAWANNKKREPDGVVFVDLASEIERRLTRLIS